MIRATVPAALLLLGAVMNLASSPANAAVPAAERLHVTDPELLQLLGYSPDAENVFLWKRAELGRPAPIEKTVATRALAAGAAAVSSSGFAFLPLADSTEYLKGPSFLVFNGALTSVTNGGTLETQLDLDQAANLVSVGFFGSHDHSSELLTLSILERCLPFLVGGNPTETVLSTSDIADHDGGFAVSVGFTNLPIDNRLCTYHVRAVFGDGVGGAPGVLIQLSKVRAEYLPLGFLFADGFESGDTSAWAP